MEHGCVGVWCMWGKERERYSPRNIMAWSVDPPTLLYTTTEFSTRINISPGIQDLSGLNDSMSRISGDSLYITCCEREFASCNYTLHEILIVLSPFVCSLTRLCVSFNSIIKSPKFHKNIYCTICHVSFHCRWRTRRGNLNKLEWKNNYEAFML